MAKRALFLHVGAGKTGSTAIQQFLKKNRHTLERLGYEIPKIGLVDNGRTFAHHPLTEWADAYREYHSEPVWKQIASSARGHVIISSEAFHNRIAAKGGPEFFEKIRVIFRDFEIRIIFYIRRQDQWLESVYEQWIKTGTLRSGVGIEDFVRSYKRDLPAQIFSFENVYGRDSILVRPYEKVQLVNGDAAKDFVSLLNVPEDQEFIYPERNPNPRFTREALEFARWYNWACSDESESAAMRGQLLEFSRRASSERAVTRYHVHDVLPSKVRREILDRHSDDYHEIARKFLGRPDGRLFYSAPDVPNETGDIANSAISMDAFIRMEAYLYRDVLERLSRLEDKVLHADDDDK